MSGVEEVQLSFWQITLICFCSLYGEERIVLSRMHWCDLTTLSIQLEYVLYALPPFFSFPFNSLGPTE